MANANFATDRTMGVKLDRIDATPAFKLGQTVTGTNGRNYIYVKAAGTIAAGATCTLDASFNATAGAGNYTAVAAMALNDYGWVYKAI